MKKRNGLLSQNVYRLDLVSYETPIAPSPSHYVDLKEAACPSGITLMESVQEYPITPEYVQSFLDSTDYKTQLSESMNASPRGINLGTFCSSVSDLLSLMSNPDEVRSLADRLKSIQLSQIQNQNTSSKKEEDKKEENL